MYLDKLDGLSIGARQPLSIIGSRDNDARDLYIISDFQRSAINDEVIDRIDGQGKVILVPIAGKPAANVYVDSVWLNDAFVRPRTNVGLHVQLRNGGLLAARDCPVKVFLGNRQVGAFRVDIAAGQVTTQVLQVQVQDDAMVLGRVVTEDAAVAFDNVFNFTLQPSGVIRVLEIGEEPVTRSLYENEPLFAYSFSRAVNVDYARLREADLVVVREVREVEAGLRDGLRAVLKRGGSVVVVPGNEPVGHRSYQLLFTDLGLGTVEWAQKTAAPELREVAMPNAREPFFREVFGAQQRAATMPRIAPVLRWARTGTDLLRLRDGDSYLAKFTSGAGQVYVFSAPFAREYSDFVAHALFVPVMYRMAMLSYRNEQLPAYRLSSNSISLQLGRKSGTTLDDKRQGDETGFRFVKDSLMLIPPQRVVGQEVQLELPEGMDQAGFYQVKKGTSLITTLAFNQSKQESELACYSTDELRALIGPNRPNVQVLEGGVDGVGLAKYRAEQAGTPLWRYFVALALVCLLAEAVVVRFGARRKPGAKLSAA
ncbi:hypothetical protein BEN47_16905 [Hymenobacter lapidarius]|uniref:Uncharacterized protein n=1 Tax=Hymenobacter lapidarius TaxID=1908237 RepID=A0A1G1SZJ8_9BACT|nr:hypothetical protein BEN47_16905 [Hymenobacter lapidarius]